MQPHDDINAQTQTHITSDADLPQRLAGGLSHQTPWERNINEMKSKVQEERKKDGPNIFSTGMPRERRPGSSPTVRHQESIFHPGNQIGFACLCSNNSKHSQRAIVSHETRQLNQFHRIHSREPLCSSCPDSPWYQTTSQATIITGKESKKAEKNLRVLYTQASSKPSPCRICSA